MGFKKSQKTVDSLDDVATAMSLLFDAFHRPKATLWCNYDSRTDGFHFFACSEDWENQFELTFGAQGKTPEECAEFMLSRIIAFKPRPIKKDW